MPLPTVHVAVWHHRHGEDVFLAKTEKGRLKIVAEQVVLGYLSELDREEDQNAIRKLCDKGKYSEAIRLWGECREDEYVDFCTALLNP